jgi:hypothetical protein
VFLFVIIGGGFIIRIPEPLRPPAQPSQKNHQKPKNLKAKLIVFVSASRHVFFDLIEPVSKRTQEHVQGHIVLKSGTLKVNLKGTVRIDLKGQP